MNKFEVDYEIENHQRALKDATTAHRRAYHKNMLQYWREILKLK